MRLRRLRSRLLFIVGGASSGKSEVALRLAAEGMSKTARRAFVATGEGLDEEMVMKIARHRQARSSAWETAEVPLDVTAWFEKEGKKYRVILLDCITMWLSNHCERGAKDEDVIDETNTLLGAIRRTDARVVLVSNELGMGLVPGNPQSRRFRELAGKINRLVAEAADEAYFVVSGMLVPLRGKG